MFNTSIFFFFAPGMERSSYWTLKIPLFFSKLWLVSLQSCHGLQERILTLLQIKSWTVTLSLYSAITTTKKILPEVTMHLVLYRRVSHKEEWKRKSLVYCRNVIYCCTNTYTVITVSLVSLPFSTKNLPWDVSYSILHPTINKTKARFKTTS